ncbi:MAG: hypothetical protein NTV23_15750 [Propionibacteriales bacterium]|nr:hypothetical protein [Propionibacteriales bacterium]
MRTYGSRSALVASYAFVALTVLGSLGMVIWGLSSEITAGPAHDDEMFAGIGYLVAALWGVPAAFAAVLLTAGRVLTDRHEIQWGLTVLALAFNAVPWLILLALR